MQDDEKKKNIWLWTTTANSKQPWDFDSFRVFVWSLRRHRYETGYIERNLQGYSPVLLKEVELASKTGTSKYPGFSICIDRKDGQRVRREYALMGVAIRYAGEHPCEAPVQLAPVANPAPLSGLRSSARGTESRSHRAPEEEVACPDWEVTGLAQRRRFGLFFGRENRSMMTPKKSKAFDIKAFLNKANGGRTIATYATNTRIFDQGDPADAIFYIQKGKIKLTVVSKQGKEAVVAILGEGDFFGEGCLAGQPFAWHAPPRSRNARR